MNEQNALIEILDSINSCIVERATEGTLSTTDFAKANFHFSRAIHHLNELGLVLERSDKKCKGN